MATLTVSALKYKSTNDIANLAGRRKQIIDAAESITDYLVPYNLRRLVAHRELQGLPKHYLIPPKEPLELHTFVADICKQLEEENADFFHNLPEGMNVQVSNAKTVYISVCKSVFADGIINWGRLMSIFTLASVFAVYFTKKGQTSIVPTIPQWIKDVVETELADWIIEQGGWDVARSKLTTPGVKSPKWSRMVAYGGVAAVAAGLLLFRNGKLS